MVGETIQKPTAGFHVDPALKDNEMCRTSPTRIEGFREFEADLSALFERLHNEGGTAIRFALHT